MSASPRASGTAVQRLDQPLDADRLGQVVVHARLQAHLPVALHRVGRHGDDAQAVAAPARGRGSAASRRDRRARASARPSGPHRRSGARPTRPPRCRSTPGRRGSPSAAAGACASFWFTTLSSASRMRSGWRAAMPASSFERRGLRGRRLGDAVVGEQVDERVEQLRLAHRLGKVGVEQRLDVAGLAPAERAEQHERQLRRERRGCGARARGRPSRACACRGSRGRRLAVAASAAASVSASTGDSVSRATHAPLGGLQREDAPVGRVVVDDQDALALQLGLDADEVAAPCSPAARRPAPRS